MQSESLMEILAKVISALTSHLFMIAAKCDILRDDENDSQRLTLFPDGHDRQWLDAQLA